MDRVTLLDQASQGSNSTRIEESTERQHTPPCIKSLSCQSLFGALDLGLVMNVPKFDLTSRPGLLDQCSYPISCRCLWIPSFLGQYVWVLPFFVDGLVPSGVSQRRKKP